MKRISACILMILLTTPLSPAAAATDEYGYTFEQISKEFVSMDPINDPLGPTGKNKASGPVDLGFTFKFYGRSYTQIYISTNGLLSFDAAITTPNRTTIPRITAPNNLIAPYWTPIGSVSSGKIRYHTEGEAPNRKFAVEWQNVDVYNSTGGTDKAWFQAILKESGEIVFFYFTVPFSFQPSVGIEDESGWHGVGSSTPSLNNQTSWHCAPPAAAARAKLTPPIQHAFGASGRSASYTMTVLNAGDLGSDTFDIAVTNTTWPVSLFHADGVTPLIDTDGDTQIDTGLLAAGSSVDIVVKTTIPSGADAGAESNAGIEFTSSLQLAVKKTAALRTSVPAPFQQALHSDAAPTKVALNLNGPLSQLSILSESRYSSPVGPAVAKLNNGGTIQTWSAWRTAGSYKYLEIEYALFDSLGNVTKPPTRLTQQSANNYVWDYPPALAVAPDGKIGLLWVNLHQSADYMNFVYNMYFAVLDSNGNVTTAPVNLTGNTVWQTYYVYNAYYSPAIAATGDNRFVLAYYNSDKAANYVTNLWLASRSTSGAQVTAPTNYSNNTGLSNRYNDPTLLGVSNNRVLLLYKHFSSPDGHNIRYIVLNSNVSIPSGNVEAILATSDSVSQPDAALLPNGNILVGWLGFRNIQYAYLDPSFIRIGSPHTISSLFDVDVTNLSVTYDKAGRGILTWSEDDRAYDVVYGTPIRPRLFYVLLDPAGNVLTAPLAYHTSISGTETSPGYGNAVHEPLKAVNTSVVPAILLLLLSGN